MKAKFAHLSLIALLSAAGTAFALEASEAHARYQGEANAFVDPGGVDATQAGVRGPIREDAGVQVYVGDANPYIDTGGIVAYPAEAGAKGPLRTEPLRYVGDANPFTDPGGVERTR